MADEIPYRKKRKRPRHLGNKPITRHGVTTPPRPQHTGPLKGKMLAQDLAGLERVKKAIQLSIAGATYEQIAEQCGYADRSAAYKAVKRRLDELHRECILSAAEWREHRLQSLKARERALNLIVQSTTSKVSDKVAAIRVLNQIDERIAAITGTDKPIAHELAFTNKTFNVKDLSDEQIARLASGDHSVLGEAPARVPGASHPRTESTGEHSPEGGEPGTSH